MRAFLYALGSAAMYLAIDVKRQPQTTNLMLAVGMLTFGVLAVRQLSPDRIAGGRAEGLSPADFDAGQLELGTPVELEHTPDRELAREIAMDHLVEDPRYYEKLLSLGL